jgi:hypothetical protein
MTKNEALKMAIEAFDNIDMSNQTNEECARAWFIEGYVQALEWPPKEALEQPSVAELNDEYLRDTYVQGLSQPAQEPVGWMDSEGRFRLDFKTEIVRSIAAVNKEIPLYTHPAPLWVGLSDDDIEAIMVGKNGTYFNFARAVEQALKEKNT